MSSQISYALDEVFGCFTWNGRLSDDGYPIVWRGRKPVKAHRIVYEQSRGPVEEGLFLDHMCRNRKCVAPHHLEPVDRDENEKRKSWRYRARREKCPQGHELRVHGVVTPQGGRVCRQCNNEAKEAM